METDLQTWVVLGTLVALFSVALVRRMEHSWVAPASIFFVAFYCHAYIAPAALYQVISTYNVDTLPTALAWSLGAQLSFLFGYWVVARKVATRSVVRMRRMYTETGSFLAAMILLSCVIVYLANMVVLDKFSLSRGAFAYMFDESLLGRAAFASEQLIAPLALALLLSLGSSSRAGRALTKLALLIATVSVVGVALATFARFQAAFLLMILFATWHWRIRPITVPQAAVLALTILVIAMFAELRNFGVGLAGLTVDEFTVDFFEILVTHLNPISALILVGTAISGQEVFTQILDIVPRQESLRWGGTYLDSLTGLLTPRLLWGYETIDTPAFWFRDVYSPQTLEHGFDFSMLSEAYMNFGALMLLVPLAVGAALAYLSTVIRTSGSALAIAWGVIAVFALVRGIRTDSSGLLKTTVYPILPILTILVIERVLRFAARPGSSSSQPSVYRTANS